MKCSELSWHFRVTYRGKPTKQSHFFVRWTTKFNGRISCWHYYQRGRPLIAQAWISNNPKKSTIFWCDCWWLLSYTTSVSDSFLYMTIALHHRSIDSLNNWWVFICRFIYTILGFGITLCVVTCCGHIAAETANGFYLYMVSFLWTYKSSIWFCYDGT